MPEIISSREFEIQGYLFAHKGLENHNGLIYSICAELLKHLEEEGVIMNIPSMPEEAVVEVLQEHYPLFFEHYENGKPDGDYFNPKDLTRCYWWDPTNLTKRLEYLEHLMKIGNEKQTEN